MRRVAGATLAALVGATAALGACSDDDPEPRGLGGAPTTLAISTTTSTTVVPPVGEPLVVSEQGLTSFPDAFDPDASLGSYGVILQNPNADLMAAGVRVVTRVLDAAGVELLADSTLLNAVMPGQRMALGRTIIEPIAGPASLAVSVEVSAWMLPSEPGSTLLADGVVTEPEANGGAVTRFTVSSTWPEPEEGVDVTAIYRGADGRILGAEGTTLAVVRPQTPTEGQIRLLAPIPGVTATELFVGRGLAAQTIG